MELREAIRRRRMVRTYDADRPVPRALIDGLLELAIRAPSAGFSQGWRFLVLDDPESIGRFWSATAEDGPPDRWLDGMRRAPVLIVALSDKDAYLDRYAEPDKGWTDRDESRWPVPYWQVDTGMAALLILLGAVDDGLAACLFGIAPSVWPAVQAVFAVPAGLEPVAVLSLGYPDPDLADRRSPSLKRGRRPIGEVTHYNSF
jgi:nitroreductase